MRRFKKLWANSDGAVAPTVALSLTGLIAAGSIAFDYARLASMDTELQDAADQAALAAAAQLDGQPGACARAAAAASAMVANKTMFANDNSNSTAINVQNESTCDAQNNVRFYQSYDQTNDTFGAAATTNANAKVVAIQVDNRKVFYALTPIVATIAQPDVHAVAVATLSSAICKTPPVMMCNPAESPTNTNEGLAYNPTRGIGLRLVTGDATVPGNFGWLQSYDANGNLISGAAQLKAMLGYNTPLGDCHPVDQVQTQPGMDAAVLQAFNTRFDVYANGASTCPSIQGVAGTCSPPINTRKDIVCKPNNTNTACDNNPSWKEATNPYHPTAVGDLDGTADPSTMGYPMDECHAVKKAANTCGIQGNGTWDRDAYFRVNYGWDHATWTANLGTSTPSRFDVYTWEKTHQNNGGKGIAVPKIISGTEAAFSTPANGLTGIDTPDRRRMSVAVINCYASNLHGSASSTVATWLDIFLVQPAFQRGPNSPSDIFTDQKDIYVEVIGSTNVGVGNSLVVRRDVPYLLR